MKGLEISKEFFEECVQQIITKQIPEVDRKYAAGLIGYGSDVLGNDDELSRDHEWGPRLIIFISKKLHKKYSGKIDNVLDTYLPDTFNGIATKYVSGTIGAVPASQNGFHHIVITTPERFLKLNIGVESAPRDDFRWLLISEQRLLEVTQGEIFIDYTGQISKLREKFSYYPKNVWKYKLAFLLESISWENDLVPLCGRRGDYLSMDICTAKTIERIMKLCFTLNTKYCPLYLKWLHREFMKLPELSNDIEPYLRSAFENTDYNVKVMNLNKAYDRIAEFMTEKKICSFYAADSSYFRGNAKYDFQRSAKEVLGTVDGDLKKRGIGNQPLGTVDQWIENEDFLLSAHRLEAAKNIYFAKETTRNKVGDSMI